MYAPWRNGVFVGAFGMVVVVVVVGAAGEEGVVGAAGEGGVVGAAGEGEVVGGFELPVAPFEIATARKCVGLRTSERSCHVESRAAD
jgi:hypothetical protein